MMNGGNMLVLKQILGHSNIQMTMIYAHFVASHLESTLTFNPLERHKNGDQIFYFFLKYFYKSISYLSVRH